MSTKPKYTREEYDDIEGYAVAATVGLLSRDEAITDMAEVAGAAFDMAEALLAEKKKRLGEKPDHHF